MCRRIKSIEELERLAAQVAASLIPGTTIGFSGELGAGKTTFMRFLVRALGSSDPVSSPTFVVQQIYSAPLGEIEHWDLYRLQEVPSELWEPPRGVRCIEWYEKFPELASLVDRRITLALDGEDPNARFVEVR